MRLQFAMCAAGILASLPVRAFDAWGFHSQMSVREATAISARLGFGIAIGADANPVRTVGYYRTAADSDAGIGYVASFCGERLDGIALFTRGTFGALVDVLQDLSRSYGEPTISASSQMLPDGRYRWIKLEFKPRHGDNVSLTARTEPGSETSFRISVEHHSGESCMSGDSVRPRR